MPPPPCPRRRLPYLTPNSHPYPPIPAGAAQARKPSHPSSSQHRHTSATDCKSSSSPAPVAFSFPLPRCKGNAHVQRKPMLLTRLSARIPSLGGQRLARGGSVGGQKSQKHIQARIGSMGTFRGVRAGKSGYEYGRKLSLGFWRGRMMRETVKMTVPPPLRLYHDITRIEFLSRACMNRNHDILSSRKHSKKKRKSLGSLKTFG